MLRYIVNFEHEIDRVRFEVWCHLDLYSTYMKLSCNVKAGNQHMISASNSYEEETNKPEVMMANVAKKARDNLLKMMSLYGPRTSDRYDRVRFSEADEVPAFIGWLILKCGLNLGGALRNEFVEEITAFEAYPNKNALLSDIAYVMNSKY